LYKHHVREFVNPASETTTSNSAQLLKKSFVVFHTPLMKTTAVCRFAADAPID